MTQRLNEQLRAEIWSVCTSYSFPGASGQGDQIPHQSHGAIRHRRSQGDAGLTGRKIIVEPMADMRRTGGRIFR